MNFLQVVDNLKELLNVKEDYEVAKQLGISRSGLSNMKKANNIPIKKIILFCDKEGWSPNWIFWNEGPKRRADINNEGIILTDQIKELISCLEDKGPLIESLLLLLKERTLPNKENLVQVGGNENPR